MNLLLLALAIFAFYYYYKKWGKSDFLNKSQESSQNGFFNKFSRGAKGFAKSFAEGVREEHINELQRRVNYYTIALLAKIAKSDGRVSQSEADMISQILDANAKDSRERAFLKASFNEHKENLNDAFFVAKEFLKEVFLPKNERFNLLRVLVFMALIDGEFSAKKQEILHDIARAFEISKDELESFISSLNSLKKTQSAMSLEKAYEILNLSKNADLSEVKKAYRSLAKKYHPDVLNANNVSENELKSGVEKFQQINEAYELIKKKFESKS